jgi:hypothetical protein
MKKKSALMGCAAFSLCLASCNPSTIDEAAAFLDEHEAAIYYCAEQSDGFSRVKDHHDMAEEELPEEFPHFCAFAIDSDNSGSSLSKAALNQIHSALTSDSYVFCYIFNIKGNVSFVNGSELGNDIRVDSYNNLTYIRLDNAKPGRYISCYPITEFDPSKSEFSLHDYQASIMDDYHRAVEKVLLED